MKKFLILGFVLLSGGLPVEARDAENEANVEDRNGEDLQRDRNGISLVSEQEKLLFAEKIRVQEDGDRSRWLLINGMIIDRNCVLRNLVALRDLGFRLNIRQPDSLDDKIKKIIEDSMMMTNLSRHVVLNKNYELDKKRTLTITDPDKKTTLEISNPDGLIENFERFIRMINSVQVDQEPNKYELHCLLMNIGAALKCRVGRSSPPWSFFKEMRNKNDEQMNSTEELLETIVGLLDRLIRRFDEQAVNFLKDAILKLVYMNLQRP